jgi:hypothetical protein
MYLQDARLVHLFHLEFHRSGVVQGDDVRNLLSDVKCLLPRLSPEEHEHGVGISVDHFAAPFLLIVVDHSDGSLEDFSALGNDGVAHFGARHAAGKVGRRVAVGDVGDQFETQLAGVQHFGQDLVLFVVLHRLLDHESGLQYFSQHGRKYAQPDGFWDKSDSVW